MNKNLPLIMKTLTPLWTGGIETNNMDRVHETAIIGSLRWWYEAVVRGLGGKACDYNNQGKSKCGFDANKYNDYKTLPPRERLRKAGLCDVCQLFGATGWQRRFTVTVGTCGSRLFKSSRHDKILLPSGRVHVTTERQGKKSRAGGWYLLRDSMAGEIPLDFRFVDPGDAEKMKVVLKLIEKYGALGGKKSSGYGVVQFIEANTQSPLHADITSFTWAVKNNQPPGARQLPDLRDFFFAKIKFTPPSPPNDWWFCLPENHNALKREIVESRERAPTKNPPEIEVKEMFSTFIQSGFCPLSPTMRNWLRFIWGKKLLPSPNILSDREERFLFGSTDNNLPTEIYTFSTEKDPEPIHGLASKICVSHAYRVDHENNIWEFRIWGLLPYPIPAFNLTRRKPFLDDLGNALKTHTFAQYMQSACNTSHPFQFEQTKWMSNNNYQNGFDYLHKLLIEQEDAAK